METMLEWVKTLFGGLAVAALALYLWHRSPSKTALEWLKMVLGWLVMAALALYALYLWHHGLPSQP
jgi:hypothetical protein